MGFGTSARLRELLDGNSIATLGGAHDALSARIIEEAGYSGVWASSFGISLAYQCIPDADLLTMSEVLEVVRHIVKAVRSPVLADCNAGFGNAVNVMRMVREFEAAGVAGVCIEDNLFPKRCSLYQDSHRGLLPAEEMVGKIRAAKAAQRDSDFVVVARLEALIGGFGLGEALERADAYSAAGADAILVHGKQFSQIQEFVAEWQGGLPLVVVPTLYNHVSLAELEQCGIRLAIYPNQAARAAVRAMQEAMAEILRTGVAKNIDDRIVPLAEVYRLVRLSALQEAEQSFLPSQTTTQAWTASSHVKSS